MNKSVFFLISLIISYYTPNVYSADATSVSIFASNNVGTIKPLQAYQRLLSGPQEQLENTIDDIMQSNHMEQGKSEDIIGMYQMEATNDITSDNTKVYTTSPYQVFSDAKVFEISKEMANKLNQESVAVFIPDEQANTAEIVVHLRSHTYHLKEVLDQINNNLPQDYTTAFSIHLNNKFGGFKNATIDSVEWLGSQLDPNIIQTAFAGEEIKSKNGKAFLVFKNGQIKEL